MLGKEVIPGLCEAGSLLDALLDTVLRAHMVLSSQVEPLPDLPRPPLPGLCFLHQNILPFVSDAGPLSHKLAPNLSPEILAIPEPLSVFLYQMPVFSGP